MTYVEWLRVRNVLRVLAIVLGLLVVASLILRISFARYINDDAAFIQHVQTQHGSKVSSVVLADGTKRTIIDDPADRTRVTIDNLGYGGRHIVITEPRAKKNEKHDIVNVGSVKVIQSVKGDQTITIIDTNEAVPFYFYVAAASLVALVIATMLGAPFARDNDGHLEIALTRPASRIELAVRTMGVDAAGMLAGAVMTIVALILCQAMFEIPHFDFGGDLIEETVLGMLLPLTWYAMLVAATSSLKRGYGAVIGFAWPAAILVIAFAVIPWGNSLLGTAVHNIFWVVSRIDPLTYVSLSAHNQGDGNPPPSLVALGFAPRAAMESVLLLLYVALALVQWRRVEA